MSFEAHLVVFTDATGHPQTVGPLTSHEKDRLWDIMWQSEAGDYRPGGISRLDVNRDLLPGRAGSYETATLILATVIRA